MADHVQGSRRQSTLEASSSGRKEMGIRSWYLEVRMWNAIRWVFWLPVSPAPVPAPICTAVYNPNFSAQEVLLVTTYPIHLSWVLFSSDIGEECILGGYNPWPLNKILEMPYSFPPTLFQILSKWAVPSFRKFCICAFLCLLSQIQSWYPALVCSQTHPLFVPYCYTVKVNMSNTCTMKKHFYLFKQDLEGALSFTQAGGDSKEKTTGR